MRLLLVEDDRMIGSGLRAVLQSEGHAVDWVRDIRAARAALASERFDLILLDLGLPASAESGLAAPELDGITLLRELRGRRDPTPVIVITARDAPEARILGLDSGADDYLTKPFAFSELVARLHVLMRRGKTGSASEPTVLRLHDLEMDLLKRRATRAGKRLDLSAKEFNLLALFLRRPGEVLSRTEIAEQVWDMNFDSNTNVVEVAIRRLRSKVDEPFDLTLLHTVRGMGYVMELRV